MTAKLGIQACWEKGKGRQSTAHPLTQKSVGNLISSFLMCLARCMCNALRFSSGLQDALRLREGGELSLSNAQTFRFSEEFTFALPAPLLFQFSINFVWLLIVSLSNGSITSVDASSGENRSCLVKNVRSHKPSCSFIRFKKSNSPLNRECNYSGQNI